MYPFFNIGSIWGWMVNARSMTLYLLDAFYRQVRGPPGRSGGVRKISPFWGANSGPSRPQRVATQTTLCKTLKLQKLSSVNCTSHQLLETNQSAYSKTKQGCMNTTAFEGFSVSWCDCNIINNISLDKFNIAINTLYK
jgi:hypothetical protein